MVKNLKKTTEAIYLAGALDPVLEEARRCMYRAEAFEEILNFDDRYFHQVGVPYRIREQYEKMAQAEREKLAKILEENGKART